MKTFTTAVSLAAYVVAAAATPTPPAADLVARNDACGIHFSLEDFDNGCGWDYYCPVWEVVTLKLQMYSPDPDGHNVIATYDRPVDMDMDVFVGSDFLNERFGGLELVIAKNTIDNQDFTLHFGIGADAWLSSDSRCKVGKYDDETNSLQGDCSFACT